MRHSILAAIITAVSLFFSLITNAQEEEQKLETPKWASDKGFWVVESNKKTPKQSTVYFYNNENILVYKEEIINKKLKVSRKKTLLRLKSALEEAVLSYEQGTWARQENILAQRLEQ